VGRRESFARPLDLPGALPRLGLKSDDVRLCADHELLTEKHWVNLVTLALLLRRSLGKLKGFL